MTEPAGDPRYEHSGMTTVYAFGDDTTNRGSPTGVPIYRESGCKERTFGDDIGLCIRE